MPSSDLVLNVRQLAGYTPTGQAFTNDSVLIQRGLGGPYLTISPADLVATALSTGGSMAIGGPLTALSIQAGSAQFSNLSVGLFSADNAMFSQFDAAFGAINGEPIAVQSYVDAAVGGAASNLQTLYNNFTVWSFNGRNGNVWVALTDILSAGGAPIHSPVFTGCPSAPTPAPLSRNTRLATTEWAWGNIEWSIQNLLATQPFVFSFNGRSGDVTLTMDDIVGADAALLQSPAFQGTPTAPTAAPGTNTDQLSTTAFVQAAIAANNSGLADIYAPINSPAFTGMPTALTAPPGTSSGQLATTAFVMNAVQAATAGVASFNGRTGIVQLVGTDITNAGGALLASPVFSGTPTAPTASAGNDTNQIATCAWVLNELGGANVGVMSFNGRSGAIVLNTTDITTAGGAPQASPALTGVPTAPTAATGTATQQIATTAFVDAAINSISTGVTMFNGRVGAITLTFADVSAAGGIANPSPALTGVPTAPTPATADNSTTVATTAFVKAALAAGAVTSFNTRTGAVTLSLADVIAAGGAPLANPGLTGVPTAPTAALGTSTAQLATTAFVQAAIGGFLPLSGGTLTGPLTISGAAATNRMIVGATGSSARWSLTLGDNTPESGNNAGSNFALGRLNNAGAFIDNVLYIDRYGATVQTSGSVAAGGILFVSTGAIGTEFSLSGNGGSRLIQFGSATGIYQLLLQMTSGNFNFVQNGVVTWWLDLAGNTTQGGAVNCSDLRVSGDAFVTSLWPQNGNNSGSVGAPGAAWFQVAAYNYPQQSDPRDKRDIAVASPGALRSVRETPVHRFRWAQDSDAAPLHTGFMADEVQRVLGSPAVMVGDDERKSLAVNLGDMLAVLWQAVQELAGEVRELKNAAN